jgi:hypothetical protein
LIIRLLNPDLSQRSCIRQNQGPSKDDICIPQEYVAVGFSDSKTSQVEESDVFYVCGLGYKYISTWTTKGKTRLYKSPLKNRKDPPVLYVNPYEEFVFSNSGVGVLWENIRKTFASCK